MLYRKHERVVFLRLFFIYAQYIVSVTRDGLKEHSQWGDIFLSEFIGRSLKKYFPFETENFFNNLNINFVSCSILFSKVLSFLVFSLHLLNTRLLF